MCCLLLPLFYGFCASLVVSNQFNLITRSSDESVIVTNCVFRGIANDENGACIYLSQTVKTFNLSESYFAHCTAKTLTGGAVFSAAKQVRVNHACFYDCSAKVTGLAMYFRALESILVHQTSYSACGYGFPDNHATIRMEHGGRQQVELGNFSNNRSWKQSGFIPRDYSLCICQYLNFENTTATNGVVFNICQLDRISATLSHANFIRNKAAETYTNTGTVYLDLASCYMDHCVFQENQAHVTIYSSDSMSIGYIRASIFDNLTHSGIVMTEADVLYQTATAMPLGIQRYLFDCERKLDTEMFTFGTVRTQLRPVLFLAELLLGF